MFVLSSHITITTAAGLTLTFKGVNDLRIIKSVNTYIDTATFKLPISARLNQANTQTNTVETSSVFNRGDKITIKLGYNGLLKTEFEGYISRLNYVQPLEVECEGYSYELRTKNIKHTFVKGTSIREICSYITKGTSIKLSDAIPSMKLGSALVVSNGSATKVLDHLKDNFKYSVYFYGNELYVGLQQTSNLNLTKYKLGWNVIKDASLKYLRAEDKRVKVVLKTSKAEGGKEVYTCGDEDGEVHEHIVKAGDAGSLRTLGDNYLNKLKYTGYEGKLTSFLIPYASHGQGASIIDPRYPDRSGDYYVPSVEVQYGMNGARRIVELSNKLA